MNFDRRRFTVGLALTPFAGAYAAHAGVQGSFHPSVTDRPGLFWNATPTDRPSTILFGYNRIAAAITPDIVRDGDRFTGRVKRLVVDIPNVRLPPVQLNPLPPVFGRISQATADRVRSILAGSFQAFPAANRDKISGWVTALLILGEGSPAPQPSAGGTIAQRAQAAGKSITYLLSAADFQAHYRPPDVAAMDRQIDENALKFLLTLRDKVGPIGRYSDQLYATRRAAELAKFQAVIEQQAPVFRHMYSGIKDLEKPLVERTLQTVRTAAESTFMMLSFGVLVRDGGILSQLQDAGIQLTHLA